jgi:hypothetical protein
MSDVILMFCGSWVSDSGMCAVPYRLYHEVKSELNYEFHRSPSQFNTTQSSSNIVYICITLQYSACGTIQNNTTNYSVVQLQ